MLKILRLIYLKIFPANNSTYIFRSLSKYTLVLILYCINTQQIWFIMVVSNKLDKKISSTLLYQHSATDKWQYDRCMSDVNLTVKPWQLRVRHCLSMLISDQIQTTIYLLIIHSQQNDYFSHKSHVSLFFPLSNFPYYYQTTQIEKAFTICQLGTCKKDLLTWNPENGHHICLVWALEILTSTQHEYWSSHQKWGDWHIVT